MSGQALDSPGAKEDPVDGWVRQIQAGIDVERNYERLYKHCHPRIFAYLRNKGLAPDLCEDLVQDALLKAFDKLHTFEHRSRFSTWLLEIVSNLHLNDHRRKTTAKRDGVEVPLADSLDPNGESQGGAVLAAQEPSPYEEAERKEQALALRQALSTLPPKMQRCAVLRFIEGHKYSEIATLMKLKIDTVKAHLGQAKQLLRERLGAGASRFIRLGSEEEP